MYKVPLHRGTYSAETTLLSSSEFTVTAWTYSSGVEAVRIRNSRGFVEVLPFMGQIIWEANFDGTSLTMKNMFTEPKPADVIVDTYGCFAFHSGLLSAGCPAPDDSHPLHGEFPCAPFDEAWLEITENSVAISGSYTYVQGFGHHYEAVPVVRLGAGEAQFDIDLAVTNKSKYQPMPLQYMCHMNYAYVDNARFGGNVPDDAFKLRESVPAHVQPTPEWTTFNKQILGKPYVELSEPEKYDPEIVWFAEDLAQYGETIEVTMGDFVTSFDSAEFPVATRWVLHNPDQQVAAFVLPGTCRPEGFKAAQRAGTLVQLAAGQTREFHVRTGLRSEK
ncbi:aldose 1-epimerase family protein [Corynebacterium epidermidicanis]|uniref:Putative DUF4432 family protein n=1 Tax=Corynebacterium epidermidicanis TaxID=1050174 RepID=A0A0G3GMC1_9CORY|nr:aldose 1-epimerase family protein [Corynebacterium epidermidicanis]AKK02381.1 putative DUF4432 family protein [Corynebacterium epidermidicanis]